MGWFGWQELPLNGTFQHSSTCGTHIRNLTAQCHLRNLTTLACGTHVWNPRSEPLCTSSSTTPGTVRGKAPGRATNWILTLYNTPIEGKSLGSAPIFYGNTHVFTPCSLCTGRGLNSAEKRPHPNASLPPLCSPLCAPPAFPPALIPHSFPSCFPSIFQHFPTFSTVFFLTVVQTGGIYVKKR